MITTKTADQGSGASQGAPKTYPRAAGLFWLVLLLGGFWVWEYYHQFEFHTTTVGRQEFLFSCSKVTGECKEQGE